MRECVIGLIIATLVSLVLMVYHQHKALKYYNNKELKISFWGNKFNEAQTQCVKLCKVYNAKLHQTVFIKKITTPLYEGLRCSCSKQISKGEYRIFSVEGK